MVYKTFNVVAATIGKLIALKRLTSLFILVCLSAFLTAQGKVRRTSLASLSGKLIEATSLAIIFFNLH